jgi:hypothetical protein
MIRARSALAAGSVGLLRQAAHTRALPDACTPGVRMRECRSGHLGLSGRVGTALRPLPGRFQAGFAIPRKNAPTRFDFYRAARYTRVVGQYGFGGLLMSERTL